MLVYRVDQPTKPGLRVGRLWRRKQNIDLCCLLGVDRRSHLASISVRIKVPNPPERTGPAMRKESFTGNTSSRITADTDRSVFNRLTGCRFVGLLPATGNRTSFEQVHFAPFLLRH